MDSSNNETRPRPTKLLPCQYCGTRFRRQEHVRRHERIHTKETPFKCSCGKAFSRRDLLRRHQNSAHVNELPSPGANGNVDPSIARRSSTTATPDQIPQRLSKRREVGQTTTEQSESISEQTLEGLFAQPQVQSDAMLPNVEIRSSLRADEMQCHDMVLESQLAGGIHADLLTESTSIQWWDDVDFDTAMFPPDLDLENLPQMPFSWPSNQQFQTLQSPEQPPEMRKGDSIREEQNASFSRLGSPLPYLQSELAGRNKSPAHQPTIRRPCWKISRDEHLQILTKLQEFVSVLPKDFVMPSRHTMSRFLQGCIKGLLEHLPFVHIATFSVTTASVELLLAMATVGAYSRFEPHRGEMFFYAAKAVIFEQIDRQSRKSIPNSSGLMNLTSPAPSSTKMSKQTANSSNYASSEHEANTEGMPHDDDASLQTLQALLCLLVCGAWGPRHLINEAVFIQSITASRARNCGLSEPDESGIHDWHTWIRKEVRKRTALSVYSFLNLMCIAYNQPPLISNGEVQCGLPVASKEWTAETAEEWKMRRSTETGLSFHDGVESLFSYPPTRITKLCLPAFANYILILSILQRIYFLRQAYSNSTKTQPQEALRSGDTEAITRALRAWQGLWERSPESSIDPQSGMGPIAFNSTGLLRLAWVRLYSDLGSYTNLASRDSTVIAAAFRNAPPLQRSPKITQAVLHAAHALAVPVRMGIAYVAKTQNVSWGVQHSMSNLECAIFLSKWLEQIAVTAADQPFSAEEWIIIDMLEAMVQEAGLERTTISVRTAHDKEQKTFQLAADVSRLWAEIFQGVHVFDMVTTIGTSLSQYANLMTSTHSPRST